MPKLCQDLKSNMNSRPKMQIIDEEKKVFFPKK